MLQKAVDKLHGGKAHGASAVAFGLFVVEKDSIVFNLDDAVI